MIFFLNAIELIMQHLRYLAEEEIIALLQMNQ